MGLNISHPGKHLVTTVHFDNVLQKNVSLATKWLRRHFSGAAKDFCLPQLQATIVNPDSRSKMATRTMQRLREAIC